MEYLPEWCSSNSRRLLGGWAEGPDSASTTRRRRHTTGSRRWPAILTSTRASVSLPLVRDQRCNARSSGEGSHAPRGCGCTPPFTRRRGVPPRRSATRGGGAQSLSSRASPRRPPSTCNRRRSVVLPLERLERLRRDPTSRRGEHERQAEPIAPESGDEQRPHDYCRNEHGDVKQLPVDIEPPLELLVDLGRLVEARENESAAEDERNRARRDGSRQEASTAQARSRSAEKSPGTFRSPSRSTARALTRSARQSPHPARRASRSPGRGRPPLDADRTTVRGESSGQNRSPSPFAITTTVRQRSPRSCERAPSPCAATELDVGDVELRISR